MRVLLSSSPSGDGLVREELLDETEIIIFSSPLGDGLVQNTPVYYVNTDTHFRPRVGMGWFCQNLTAVRCSYYFRPRLGMGWFLRCFEGG